MNTHITSEFPSRSRRGVICVRLETRSEFNMAAMETAGKPITCKAAVMWETGKPLVLEEVRAVGYGCDL